MDRQSLTLIYALSYYLQKLCCRAYIKLQDIQWAVNMCVKNYFK